MADVVSELNEDGGSTIVEASQSSNYEMSINQLDGKLPEAPPLDALSKIFKPRYVLEITAPDGTVIPFVYKRIDPAMLLLTQGSPLAVDISDTNRFREENDRIASIEDEQERVSKMQEFLKDPKTQAVMQAGEETRKRNIQAGVISPEITDELYANLDDDVIDALNEAVTGGVTNSNELVEHFREKSEDSELP